MKYILIENDFKPLSIKQFNELNKYRNHNKFCLVVNFNNSFKEINYKFFKRYFNIQNKCNHIDLSIKLDNEIEYNVDNFKLIPDYYRYLIFNNDELIEELVSKNVSKHRYEHSKSVSRVCVSLAKKYNLDVRKAYLMGILHDICKDVDESVQDEYFKYLDPDKLDTPLPIKHSFCGKYYLKDKLNLYDNTILEAIYNHTILNSKSLYSIILYIADKREPLRNIDDNILDVAYTDIYESLRLLEINVKEYLKEHGKQ